ncbi:MAG TPA: HD domain-containing protein [Dissulfurispiraceae bacterium]|nr:HD domain-containing protein [Dissulfurispiraceae bacterium]
MNDNINKDLCLIAETLLGRFADGRLIAASLSDHVDQVVRKSYCETVGTDTPGLALLAVGGYGRREQSAFSDVDILLLSARDDRQSRESAEKVLYSLWDRGIQISHAFRTLKTCADDALKDLQIRTSLFHVRLVAGDAVVYERFQQDVQSRVLYKDKRKFLGEMLREIDRRHKKYGDSVYLLEPNVKEGQGALRDMHSASWLVRSNLAVDLFCEYSRVFPNRNERELLDAVAFLLRIRSALHCISGRKNEVLSFEVQGSVAELLGFRDTRDYLAPELLLRVYYRKAQVIAEALKVVMHICSAKYFQMPFTFTMRKLNDNFALVRNEVIVRRPVLFLSLEVMLEAFYFFATTGKNLSHNLIEQIRRSALRTKSPSVLSHTALTYFWGIMKSGRVYATLVEMHRIRLFEKILPEFGRLRNLVIFEMYHRYTVDEHTLMAVRNAEAVRRSTEKSLSYLRELFTTIKPEFFFFGLLVHDIGKGISSRHEGIGYRMLKGVLERFAIGAEDGSRIAFLVKNHIFFSQLTLRRDPESSETIRQLAELVGTEDNLNALYLMTYADMSAVKPGFWSEWKAYLFQEVYRRTRDVLKGVHENTPRIQEPEVLAFLHTMPERYLLLQSADVIRSDYLLSVRARQERLVSSFSDRPDGTKELTVVSFQMPRLFSQIVGILSCRGLNIARARLYTSPEGLAIRKIIISNWAELHWEGLIGQLEHDLQSGIIERFALMPGPQRSAADLVARRFEVFAEVDNEGAEVFTILEVHFPDRIGLLYDITNIIYALDANIASAVINTDDGMAEDVFYLQYDGRKLPAQLICSLLASLWQSELSPHHD